jgi:uncharacterized protein YbaR (Trm112 family)
MGPGGCLCDEVSENEEEFMTPSPLRGVRLAFEVEELVWHESTRARFPIAVEEHAVAAANAEENAEEEVEEEKPKIDVTKPLVGPLFALPCGVKIPECAICMDDIEMVNMTITTCGHTFHASCVFRALENNETCPLCRHPLVDVSEEEEDEYEEIDSDEGSDSDSESGSDDSDDESEEDASKVNLEQLADKLTHMGYTMADILAIFVIDLKSGTNEARYSDQFAEKLTKDIDSIADGTISLSHRDNRSYAAVAAKAAQAPAEAQKEAQESV